MAYKRPEDHLREPRFNQWRRQAEESRAQGTDIGPLGYNFAGFFRREPEPETTAPQKSYVADWIEQRDEIQKTPETQNDLIPGIDAVYPSKIFPLIKEKSIIYTPYSKKFSHRTGSIDDTAYRNRISTYPGKYSQKDIKEILRGEDYKKKKDDQ